MNDGKEWIYGQYRDALIVVTRDRANECLENLETLGSMVNAASWEELLKSYTIDQIEEVLGDLLDDLWWLQEEEPDEERKYGELPDISVLSMDTEARAYAPDLLDDADQLGRHLPQEVMDLATYPETSPMTGYEPCFWDESALPQIHAIAGKNGARLVEDQMLLSKIEEAYFGI